MTVVRIGTRGSALALAQARWVAERLRAGGRDEAGVGAGAGAGVEAGVGVEVEIVEVTTAGDRGLGIGDKARWVSALEAALLDGSVDVAVHSAKDVPGELAAGTVLAAVPEREDVDDVLIGSLGPRVGTASLRRAAQLRALDPGLEIVELRGNVPTRLAKLDAGVVDGLVLAAAGLRRLGLEGRISRPLDVVPAPGQGALALQTRTESAGLVAGLDHAPAAMEVHAERALARALGASCHTPLGAWAGGWSRPELGRRLTQVELTAWVGLPDGSEWISDTAIGPADEVGERVAERMTAAGARDLLARAAEMSEVSA